MKVARCPLSAVFQNFTRVEYKGINLDTIQQLTEKKNLQVITPEVLFEAGIIAKKDKVKILGRGELKTKLDITAHGFSASARKTIEELGGIANTL
jgi:large subunit ribosomal protein L15